MRLLVGAFFILHGVTKFQHMDGIIAFFGTLGFAPYLAYATAVVEVGGGAFLILGLFTKKASFVLSVLLLVIIFKVRVPAGGLKSAELEIMYLASTLGLMLIGGGRYALSGKKCGCCNTCASGVCGCSNGTCTGCGCSPTGEKMPQEKSM